MKVIYALNFLYTFNQNARFDTLKLLGPKGLPRPVQWYLNLLQPTGHVMHHQFNIQQLYALPTLHLCVLYLSENKQRLVPLTA